MAPEAVGRARVLLITTYFDPVVGGVETHARDLALGLRRVGRRVLVLTTRVTPGLRSHLERRAGAVVLRTAPAIGRQRSTKWLFLPVVFAAAWHLRRRVDVIFCPDHRGVGPAAVVAGRLGHVPVVLQGATPGAFSLSHWDAASARLPLGPLRPLVGLAKRAVLALHRRADAVVCITREHEAEAHANGIAADRIHYIPHGVDTQRFRPADDAERARLRDALRWPSGIVVVFLGRLSLEKGLLDLLEAWRPLVSTGAHLVVVGPDMTGHDFDAGPRGRAFAAGHLSGSVLFPGSTTDAASVLRAADVLVLPSHYEAFAITPLEAMACGVPVVASYVGGLRDYLVDDENALVCPPKSPEALAKALLRVVTDASLRARLGAAGRATIDARFDAVRNIQTYQRLFDRLMTATGTARQRRM